jgi:hypothetical protein
MTPSQSKINTSTLSRICFAGSESFRTLAFKLDVDVNVRCCCRGAKAARFPAGANAEAERVAKKRVAMTELENFMVMVRVYIYKVPEVSKDNGCNNRRMCRDGRPQACKKT